MIRMRSLRASLTVGLTLSMALLLSAPTLVSARPAPLAFGVGPTVGTNETTGALPTSVSPGSKVAFDVWARNTGGSNIAKLFLTGRTSGIFHSATVVNSKAKGSCVAGRGGLVQLECSWKPLSKGGSVQVRVIFTTPASGAAMTVDFEWSSNGYVLGGNNSHGDLFTQSDSVALNGNANAFAGGFLTTGDNNVVETNPALGTGNPQSTKITSPALNIPVTAAEDDDITDCQELFYGCFGQASVLNVNNGQSFPSGFTVQIVYNSKHWNAEFVHFLDDGTYEVLEECDCETPVAPCVDVQIIGNKTYVTAYLTENGKIIGH
ncbi:MAG TPA: hypothetical protein VFK61_02810 [Candidatus Limnocylindria bacterium]|nr:hypothetical protein [Candidatus Limnocylindria bacterium]